MRFVHGPFLCRSQNDDEMLLAEELSNRMVLRETMFICSKVSPTSSLCSAVFARIVMNKQHENLSQKNMLTT